MERAAFKTRDLYSTRFSIRKARFAFVVMVRKTLLVADEIRLRIDASGGYGLLLCIESGTFGARYSVGDVGGDVSFP
jgi:hypothetical protein